MEFSEFSKYLSTGARFLRFSEPGELTDEEGEVFAMAHLLHIYWCDQSSCRWEEEECNALAAWVQHDHLAWYAIAEKLAAKKVNVEKLYQHLADQIMATNR